jgi:iron(III) transport system permease protein
LLTSGLLLGMGYAARFVAEVFAPLKTTMLQVDPRVMESARMLGATPAKVTRQVVLPAIAPGIAVATLLGFLAVAKELPVTLLLGGATGLSTLSFRIWDRYAESLWHDAGLAALTLCLVALAGVIGTLRWRRHV